MRARNIKPSLFKNELLGAADPLLTILFEGLWCEADREGRLEDRPSRIRAEVFPYRGTLDIESLLQWLHDNKFIARYAAKSLNIIQILKFTEHQRPHKNEVESVLPTLEQASTTKVRRTSNQGSKLAQPNTQALRSDSGSLIPSSLIPDTGYLIPDTPLTALPPLASVQGLDLKAWEKFEGYRKKRKPAIRLESREAAMKALAAYGSAQMEVVDNSIANGYQGLIAPKNPSGVVQPIRKSDPDGIPSWATPEERAEILRDRGANAH